MERKNKTQPKVVGGGHHYVALKRKWNSIYMGI